MLFFRKIWATVTTTTKFAAYAPAKPEAILLIRVAPIVNLRPIANRPGLAAGELSAAIDVPARDRSPALLDARPRIAANLCEEGDDSFRI
jgi:hypothetical protein